MLCMICPPYLPIAEEQPFRGTEPLQFLPTAFREVDVQLMCLGSCSQSYYLASPFFISLLVRSFRLMKYFPFLFSSSCSFFSLFPKPPRISSEHSPKLQIRSHSYLRAVSEVSINRSLDSLDPAGLLTSPKFRSRNESYMRAMSTISQVSDPESSQHAGHQPSTCKRRKLSLLLVESVRLLHATRFQNVFKKTGMFSHNLVFERVIFDNTITCPLQMDEWYNMQFV